MILYVICSVSEKYTRNVSVSINGIKQSERPNDLQWLTVALASPMQVGSKISFEWEEEPTECWAITYADSGITDHYADFHEVKNVIKSWYGSNNKYVIEKTTLPAGVKLR